jgi:hypothetical protein
MRFFIILIALLFIPVLVLGSGQMTVSQYSTGYGAHISRDSVQWEAGSDLMVFGGSETYNGGASGTTVITNPGGTKYSAESELSFQDTNQYTSSDFLSFENGGIAWNSLAISDMGPNIDPSLCDAAGEYIGTVVSGQTPWEQRVTGQIESAGVSGQYQTEKAVDNADYAFSGQGTGNISFKSEIFTSAQAGSNMSSDDLNYETSRHKYDIDYDNAAKIEFVWMDFSDPFDARNETSANETVNETVEEA